MDLNVLKVFRRYPEEAIIGDGITQENLDQLERILNVKLPKSYKEYLLTFGYGGIFGRYILGLEEPPKEGSVIDSTREYLQKGLPKGFVVIEDVHEFLYCLNTNELNEKFECPVVSFFPHSKPSIRVDYSSFKEFLEDLIEEGIDNL
ncbi:MULTISPECIES: SMI1/KNR4 family protein [Bacillaceae]|uniref:SMI1/KNR4 family protein n=1 Tax=Bacillaceae TaxID=186817 RepID=UPI001E60B8E8|nr:MULTISPECIES: SMI1/KNR4 family protein [Bacillaceae]MCE4051395.1 SMI1/KNR4 family protein [Bacillus sp. Au-Bac7]UPO89994.1 SMI1/KNR4 family protein [Niallia sp. Man26]